jgi:hypothetical protein
MVALLENYKTIKKEKKSDDESSELEEIVKAVEEAQKTGKAEKEYKAVKPAEKEKTNYDSHAEYEKSKKDSDYAENIKNNEQKKYSGSEPENRIENKNVEQLTFEEIERITKQEIVNSMLGFDRWNNISPHEYEDYDYWRKLSPMGKLIWWSLVQNSGLGVRDIVYN